jgi:hypothetical protein
MLFKLQKAVWHASLQTRHKRLSVNEEQMRRDRVCHSRRIYVGTETRHAEFASLSVLRYAAQQQ